MRHGPAHAEAAVSRALADQALAQQGSGSRHARQVGTIEMVNQAAHGFAVGDGVGPVSGTWEKLTTTTDTTYAWESYGGVAGVVIAVHGTDDFTVCVGGPATLPTGGLVDHTVYALDRTTPGLLVPFVATAEGGGSPLAVFFHLTGGRIVVLAAGSNAHSHQLLSLTDQDPVDLVTYTGYGRATLEVFGSFSAQGTNFQFRSKAVGGDFGAGTLSGVLVDGTGAAATAATWRSTGGLYATAEIISIGLQDDYASVPRKRGVAFGETLMYDPAFFPEAAGPVIWLDPDSPGNVISTRPARGKDTAPVGIVCGAVQSCLMFPMLAAVLFNRLRDLQDVEDLLGVDPADGLALVWELASKTYKHGTISSAGLADNSVTDAKLRDSAALSVIGNATNATADPADIVAGSDGYVLRRSGTALGFGTVATAGITDAAVTSAKLRDSVGVSVIGRAANTTGVPADIAAGADDRVLSRAAGALAFTQISTAMVADDGITDAKLRNSAALSVIGRSANSIGDPADIAAGVDGQVLRRSGTTLDFGTVATAGITDAAVTSAKLRDSVGVSVIGRSANTTGVPADIAAGADDRVLARAGGTLAFSQVTTAMITDLNVTGAKLENVAGVAGSYGASGANIPNLTIDGKGRVSAIANRALTAADVGAAAASHTHGLAGDVGGTTAASVIQPLAVKTGMIDALQVTTAKIADDSVTYAKLQNVAARSVVGNLTASTADPQAITADADKDVLWRDGTTLAFAGLPIEKLSDVTITSVATDDMLIKGASAWENAAGNAIALRAFLMRVKYGTGTKHTAGGTHTFAGTSKVFVAVIIGAGAGGGFGNTAGSGGWAGGGGGGGETVYLFGLITAATATVAIGAAGTGGVSGGASPTNGGSSSVTVSGGSAATAAGGVAPAAPALPGVGGKTDLTTSDQANGVVLRLNGLSGGPGLVAAISYNGSGQIISIDHAAGKGGYPGGGTCSADEGRGGDGGAPGSSGSNGKAGLVFIYEA